MSLISPTMPSSVEFGSVAFENGRLREQRSMLLAASKEALAMINAGHAEDAWIPLEAAIAKAEGEL